MTKKSDTPAIRFKGFTDTWEQRKLGELCNITTGKLDANAMVSDGQYDFYTSGIDVFKIDVAAFEGPAITIAGNGASVGYMHLADGKFNAYQRTYVLTDFLADRQFLNVAIGNELPNKIQEEVRGSGIPYIVLNMLTDLAIPFPSHEEQYAIGVYFQQLDNLITLHQRKWKRINFAVHTDQTITWEQRKLGELGTITTGSTPSTSIPDYYSDDGIVWVTPTDICENITFESARKLSDLGQQVGRVVPKNTILVTCIASIGKNTMLGNTGSFNQQINGLTPNENECDPYFLLTESALWSAKMKSSAAAGTMQIVNRTEFSELKTWLPSLIEQQAISDFFRQLDNLITLHQCEFQMVSKRRKARLRRRAFEFTVIFALIVL